MARALVRRAGWVSVAMALALAVPASAQFFSEGYNFLKSVRERDGDAVTNSLNEPGSTLVNSRDVSTGQTALHIVTERRDAVWIRFLTSKGANPNIADKNGVTPLMVAVNLGFAEGVDALMAAGARVDVTNAAGETPLISAVHRRDPALLRLLLAKGANPDRTDNSGRSARDYATLMQGNTQILAEFTRADEERKNKGASESYGPSF